ncbi:MAG TPA: hypothetical protein VIY48_16390 [Candidatus Paceibacterota bacterium]
MRVCFIYAEKDGDEESRELTLANAFLEGVALSGDETSVVTKSEAQRNPPEAEVVCMVGVKSLKLFTQMKALGKQIVYFDKGYLRHRGIGTRTWEYWRVAVNDHHPTDYVGVAKHGPTRWQAISRRRGIAPAPWRTEGDHVVYAGSSDKYHAFVGLPDPTKYAEDVIAKLKKVTDKPVLYRPKPTWLDAVPVDGARFSPRAASIEDAMRGAWCLVTNGSNSSYDATMAGIPCIILGRAVAKPLYSDRLKDVNNPPVPTNEARNQWLANIAWCMFTEEEMRMGLAWKAIRPQLDGEILDDSTINEAFILSGRPTKAMLKRGGLWAKSKRTKQEQREKRPFRKNLKTTT